MGKITEIYNICTKYYAKKYFHSNFSNKCLSVKDIAMVTEMAEVKMEVTEEEFQAVMVHHHLPAMELLKQPHLVVMALHLLVVTVLLLLVVMVLLLRHHLVATALPLPAVMELRLLPVMVHQMEVSFLE